MHFSDLSGIPKKVLYKVFLDVFSDYKLNLRISYEQFDRFLRRILFYPELSLGAFKNDQLIGFQLIGAKQIRGELLCYNAAAGIIPNYRNKYRLAYNNLKCLISLLKCNNAKYCLCEILEDNRPAIKMIQKFGGTINRKVIGYKKKQENYTKSDRQNNEYYFAIQPDLSFLSDFNYFDRLSSWQNSLYAIERLLQYFHIVTINKDHAILGFGIIGKQGGYIPQFFINENNRGKGLGRLLLMELANHTSSEFIGFSNIDENNRSLVEFLKKMNFSANTKLLEFKLNFS